MDKTQQDLTNGAKLASENTGKTEVLNKNNFNDSDWQKSTDAQTTASPEETNNTPAETNEEKTSNVGTIKSDEKSDDKNSENKTLEEKPIKQYKRVKSKFLNKILEFLKAIKWAVPSFILLVIIQQFSWQLNMWIGKDGVSLALPIDSKIPIISEFCYIYILAFPIVIFAVFFIATKDRKHYWDIWLTSNITFIISGFIYFFFQTQMTKPDFVPVTISDRFLVDIWAACKPINCFPSQHCVMGIVLFLLFYNQQKTTKLWFRITNYIVGILILLSTVFLKQHFIVDMFGSMAIMIPVYIIVKTWNFGGFMDNKMKEYSIKRASKVKKNND